MKDKERILKAREETHHIKGVLNKIISRFLIRSSGDLKSNILRRLIYQKANILKVLIGKKTKSKQTNKRLVTKNPTSGKLKSVSHSVVSDSL